MKSNANRSDYADWLAKEDWTYFATCTTGYEMSLKSARRVMERFHMEISKYFPCTMFWVAEKFKAKDGFHTHALIKVPDLCPFDLIIQLWQKVTGGKGKHKWQRIGLENYNPDKGAAIYCTKYLLKEVADWDVYKKPIRTIVIPRVQQRKLRVNRHKFKKSGRDFSIPANSDWI